MIISYSEILMLPLNCAKKLIRKVLLIVHLTIELIKLISEKNIFTYVGVGIPAAAGLCPPRISIHLTLHVRLGTREFNY
jgi:hypothetical protein